MKLTPWFPPEVKPVREGVYEITSVGEKQRFSFWNGTGWGWRQETIEDAFRYRDNVARGPIFGWRGLARKPK